MNREIEVEEIYLMNISNKEKCKRLNDFLLDCFNEMEAVDQNMHPEVHHNLSEAYQLAKNYLRTLEEMS
ncbi:hypothetical protein [Legionella quateirensis]|uniref:Uncharacterized protein n=1 Tax=Legionella quateirensis TaxID=45072 RepID=A0A378KVB4_9GAMM|nr:hypothetical protein [Legionella quateirensis]KTD43250.1 hypothetical protein Lqua_3151 [Legionella quateirensis]STY18129.1 Uncharacterised protein [Legionella quateirensis]